MKNTKKNRGFSLVELIVVVAIMAVLVGVLAPSLLRYVEKTRAQKDDSAMAEVANAIQLAIADEDIFDEIVPSVPATGTATETITFAPSSETITIANGKLSDNTTTVSAKTNLAAELGATLPATIDLGSSTYKAKSYKVTITVSAAGAVTVEGEWN